MAKNESLHFVSHRVSAFIVSHGSSVHAEPAPLIPLCLPSVIFDGGISPTEMMRTLIGQERYVSHSFVTLDWIGLVCLVKSFFNLKGGAGELHTWVFHAV